jgi:molecular chaperone DnaK (HSP70)
MTLRLTAAGRAITAWGIDLGTTNSTLCRATLAAGSQTADEPEVLGIAQPTPAGPFIGSLVPSMVALHQGREFVG